MKIIILLITFILCNLSFSCEILPNGNYIPCDITEKIIEHDYWLKHSAYYKEEIENKKIIDNIEYNVKLAESRLNEAEVKYIESIKKYKTTLHNAASKSFEQKLYSDIVKQKSYSNIAEQAVYSAIAEQKVYYEIISAKQKANYEMTVAKIEYEKARRECGRIYAIAKGEQTSLPVGKSPLEIFKLVK